MISDPAALLHPVQNRRFILAYTDLSDIIVPSVFDAYVTEAITSRSALIRSGAFMQSDMLNQYAGGPGNVVSLPHFSADTAGDADIAMDDTTEATPVAVGTGAQVAQKDFISKTWGEAQIAATLIGEDILGHVASNVVAPYFAKEIQSYAISKLTGLSKDNAASDSGDMSLDVSNDEATDVGADESFTTDTFIDARASMGDAADRLSVLVLHSKVYANLLKNEKHNCAPASATTPFATYMGHTVIIDDSMPVEDGTNRKTYTSFLLGAGAFALGSGDLGERAVATETSELKGNGWGLKTLTARRELIIHPVGFASNATVASHKASPSKTAYEAASAWDRVMDRKNCPIVSFKTNG